MLQVYLQIPQNLVMIEEKIHTETGSFSPCPSLLSFSPVLNVLTRLGSQKGAEEGYLDDQGHGTAYLPEITTYTWTLFSSLRRIS